MHNHSIDRKGCEAYTQHIKEVSEERLRKQAVMEKEAKLSHDRCHRDMAAFEHRRESLKQQLEIEA